MRSSHNNWYSLSKKAYDTETALLNRYLRNTSEGKWDPFDFVGYVEEFLLWRGDEIPEEFDEFNWVENISNEDKAEFIEWLQCLQGHLSGEVLQPPYIHMEYKKYLKPGWLAHFSDDAGEIGDHGFVFGYPEYTGLGLTTLMKNRKKGPGFNFAFPAFSREALVAANDRRYGKNAVVFWGSGVHVRHYGDEEDQVIFWGPSVRKDMIFPLFRHNRNLWVVHNSVGREMISNKSFSEAVAWIVNNYLMLQAS